MKPVKQNPVTLFSSLRLKQKTIFFITAASLTLFSMPLWSHPSYSAALYSESEMSQNRTETERKLFEIRSREITEIRNVLGRRIDIQKKVELYIRLSEAYLEQYRGEFLVEGKAHEKRLASGITDPFIDRSHSKPYLKQGLAACEEVIRSGVEHPKLDQVYYFMGVNYDELEDEANAIRAFRTLTEKYPKSPYAGEAYRALGESAYAKNNFKEALTNYQAAARNYNGAAYPKLLQKMAWSQYRMRNYDQAIETMKQAVAQTQNNDKQISLKDEALRDMALFYTERGKVDDAVSYFQKVSGDKEYYPRVLERLGAQYERNAEQEKAIQVYEMLLKTNPKDEASFRVREKMIELDIKRGAFSNAISRYKGLQLPESSSEQETIDAITNLKVITRKTGVEQHDKFRKTQNQNALVAAENFYTVYLNPLLSQKDPRNERPEILMYLAEVKKDLKKQNEAASLYKEVIRSKDPRYAKTAAALWMESLNESIKVAKQSGKVEDLQNLEGDYLEATDTTLSNFGYQPEGLAARLNTAQVLAARKDTQGKAENLIRDLIQKAPRSKQALTGARLMVQMYSDRLPPKAEENKNSPEVIELVNIMNQLKSNRDLMVADQDLGKLELTNQIAAQESKIKIGVIANQERQQDFASAAKSYADYAQTEKKREVAEKAYENAVASYLKVTDYDNATRTISDWWKRYPDSKAALESIRNAASQAIITGHFEKSARLFRVLGKRNDPNALEASGRLFEGTGNLKEAKEDFSLYVLKYSNTPERGQIILNLAQWYEYEGDDSKAISRYTLCLRENTSTSAECGARLGDLYARLETPAKAQAFYKEVADRGGIPQASQSTGKNSKTKSNAKTSISQTKKDSSPWVGYARYKLVEMSERGKVFREPLQLPDDQLKRGLEERTKFLSELNAQYQSVVEANGPWAIAALDRLATFVMNFADEIDRMNPPANSTPESIANFRKSLKTVSDPLRSQALSSWKTAYQKALSGEILSPIMPEIVDKLVRFGSVPPYLAQGFRDKFRLSGQPADGGREGKGAAYEKVRTTLLSNPKDVQSWIDYGNFLWGDGKPLLAKIAYERALTLDPKAAAALNNRGVLIASSAGQEDWIRIAEADAFFKQALLKDELFLSSKFNRGAVLNYYRLFEKARPFWRQVAAVAPQADVYDGLSISELGVGDTVSAKQSLEKALKVGAPEKRFTALYFEASKSCGSALKNLELLNLNGFEQSSVTGLKELCLSKVIGGEK